MRYVTPEKLVLQCLGGCRQQYTLATQQRRHQIGKRLANACTGLDHEHARVADGFGDCDGHVNLARAVCKLWHGPGQGTLRCKDRTHQLYQVGAIRMRGDTHQTFPLTRLVLRVDEIHHAGSWGSN